MYECMVLSAIVIGLTAAAAGVMPWSTALAGAVACCACGFLPRRRYGSAPWAVILPMALMTGMVFLSALPLPSAAGIFTAAAGGPKAAAIALLGRAGELGMTGMRKPWFCFAANRAGALRAVLVLVAGMAAAGLAVRMPPEWKLRYARILGGIIVLTAVAGFVSQWILPQGKAIWWFLPAGHGRPVGCFVNGNHFGGYVALICPALLVFCADAAGKRRWAAVALWGGAVLAASFVVLASLSRGAWIALIAGMLAVAVPIARRGRHSGIAVLCAAAAGLFMLCTAAMSNAEFRAEVASMRKLSETTGARMRVSTWYDALGIVADHPLAGVGANGFRMVFPRYRTATTRAEFRHTENEYIQLAVEGGAIGLALFAAVCAGIGLTVRRKRGNGTLDPVVGTAVLGAAAAAATHALGDFSFRVPLYFVVFCSLAGLVLDAGPAGGQPAVPDRGRRLLPAAGLLLIALVALHGNRVYRMDDSDYLVGAGANELCGAIIWSPTSWQAWYHLGVRSAELGSPEGVRLAEKCISTAAEYDPHNYRVWERLARVRLFMGDAHGARVAHARLISLRSWVRIRELEQALPLRLD